MTSSSRLEVRNAPTLILCAGFALVGLGLFAQSQTGGTGGTPGTPQTQAQPFPMSPGYGTADSNGRMIAVTAPDVTGGSLLFLIDTESRHLSVYSAQGGTASTSNVKWVGARNFDLDLQVDGYNDKSELKFKTLSQRFAESGASAAEGH